MATHAFKAVIHACLEQKKKTSHPINSPNVWPHTFHATCTKGSVSSNHFNNCVDLHISCYMHKREGLTPSFQPGSRASDLPAPENDKTTQEFRNALLSMHHASVFLCALRSRTNKHKTSNLMLQAPIEVGLYIRTERIIKIP